MSTHRRRIDDTVNKGRDWKMPIAFAVVNCVLNRRFAAVTVGSCSDCWRLRQVADEARNITENALSILIVIFSLQLQQTEISDRKLFIFQHGVQLGSYPRHLGGAHMDRSGKNTHISMISNSVTHLRSYTNTAIAGNSA